MSGRPLSSLIGTIGEARKTGFGFSDVRWFWINDGSKTLAVSNHHDPPNITRKLFFHQYTKKSKIVGSDSNLSYDNRAQERGRSHIVRQTVACVPPDCRQIPSNPLIPLDFRLISPHRAPIINEKRPKSSKRSIHEGHSGENRGESTERANVHRAQDAQRSP